MSYFMLSDEMAFVTLTELQNDAICHRPLQNNYVPEISRLITEAKLTIEI